MRALLFAFVLAGFGGVASELHAQTRADSAAVLLDAAEQLRQRGDVDAARAVLALITERYAGTPAAAEVDRMLALLRRMPEQERPGRTELLVFGTLYGAWLGVAVPIAMDSEEPSAYGIGLLLGAPAGFLAARQYANARRPTYGQARALTFGGTWGTYNGIALAEIFDWGVETETFCDLGTCYEVESGDESTTYVTSAVVGGLLGIATGAVLARKPITAGTAATATLGGMWGTWFGFGISYLADQRDDDLLAGTVIGGNASLLALGLIAPRWQMSESRARLISLGGLIGGLGGAGLLLIAETDDDDTAILFPLAGSALGLGLGAYWTRNRDGGQQEAGGRGALINRGAGGWAMEVPEASLMLRRDERGTARPGLYIPLLNASF